MNLHTLLTEAAMKGAERRAELRIERLVDTGQLGIWQKGSNTYALLADTRAECTAFIEREGLRASMAWLAEKLGNVDAYSRSRGGNIKVANMHAFEAFNAFAGGEG